VFGSTQDDVKKSERWFGGIDVGGGKDFLLVPVLRVVAQQREDELVADENVQRCHVDLLADHVTGRCREGLDASVCVEQINLDVRVDRHELAEFGLHLGHESRLKRQFGEVLGSQVRCQGLVQRLSQHEIVVPIGPCLQDQRQSAIRTDQHRDQNEKFDMQ